jgi:hypothetical protein
MSLSALNSQAHRALRIDAAGALLDHAKINIVSVIPREFARLVAQYPIFFSKSSENGRFEPAALLGFKKGENLFLTGSAWDAPYIPLQIQRQPFALLPRNAAGEGANAQPSLDIALDLDSPHIQTQRGERLFQDDGQPSMFLRNMSSILSSLVKGSSEAYAFTGRLAELNLLESVRVDIEFVDASDTHLQGLYWIAAAALKQLPAAQLAELRDRDYLEWIYFQMASIAHVSTLVARKNKQLAGATPAQSGE